MKELISELEKLKKSLRELYELQPFDRCLVRNSPYGLWIPALYGTKSDDGRYITSAGWQTECVPFEGNERLLGTNQPVNNGKENC